SRARSHVQAGRAQAFVRGRHHRRVRAKARGRAVLRFTVRRRDAGWRGVPEWRAALRRRAPLRGILRCAHPASLRRTIHDRRDDDGRRHRRSGGGELLTGDDVNYGSYLALDELLALQRPRSTPPHPDELLFIVVHQASELWFKAILRDLDELTSVLSKKDLGLSLWYMQRLNALMRIVSTQLDSLETLPPHHFAEFREHLGSSSGSQSVQFRAIEAASGLRDPHFMRALEEHVDIPPLVQRCLSRPTLQDLF